MKHSPDSDESSRGTKLSMLESTILVTLATLGGTVAIVGFCLWVYDILSFRR